ncbi:MAG: hypothetical protein ACFCVH_05845 [Alphaproteobacteria bacterium]
MTRQTGFWAAALLLCTAFPAQAQEPYEPFVGAYVGRAEAVGSDTTQVRDLDVIIKRTDDGFGIESITVNHQGDRMDPGVSRRSSAMSFIESDIEGIYQRDFERDVFATRRDMDLVEGDPLQWAQIVDGSLLVYSFVLNDDGSYELHTYRRTLDETGLSLEFVSELDGVARREVAGQLIRVEDVMDDVNP